MLGLHYQTPPAWAQQVLADPAALLLDHYFCELKAAAMAHRTLRVHGSKVPALKKLMTDLANEEMEHARQVEREIRARYLWPAAPKGGSAYVQGLRKAAAQEGNGNFLDMLLVCSLIEARSAERFRLLADELKGQALSGFYEDLYASEVNHYVLFVDLAVGQYGEARATSRLETLRAAEGQLVAGLPPLARMHYGCAQSK